MSRVIIVDDNDQEIGLKPYEKMEYGDIYRVTALWLTDKVTGDCLITQRKWTKEHDPGKWMAAVSGTVEEGESYDENIVHEIEEEIGLTELNLTKSLKRFIDDRKHKFFVQWYTARVDKDETNIKIQDEEVEAYAWISKDELVVDVKKNPENYVPSMAETMEALGFV